jgi:hypothetical protein
MAMVIKFSRTMSMEQLLGAIVMDADMLWKALLALIFGNIISASIQVLVT